VDLARVAQASRTRRANAGTAGALAPRVGPFFLTGKADLGLDHWSIFISDLSRISDFVLRILYRNFSNS
jgi:hypothetical protein